MELEPFLVPVDESNPSGLELRNEPDFFAIGRLMEPAARSLRLEGVKSGGTGAVAVDWGEIVALSGNLARKGRDIRLLVVMVRALANTEGFSGLEQGLNLLTESVTRYWDSLHPTLRANSSPGEAARGRINAIKNLENSVNGLLCDLEYTVLFSPRSIGPLTCGDICAGGLSRSLAQSELPSGLGDREMAELMAKHDARVERVLRGVKIEATERAEDLGNLIRTISAARVALSALEDAMTARVGENGVSFKLPELEKILNRVLVPLQASQANSSADGKVSEGTVMAESIAPAPAPNGAHPPAGTGNIPGAVNSRRDVERCLDMIIDFYERTEPSSPIPHLARRMRKMVPMNFMQLMEEIAPSGMKEFKNVAGVDDKTKSAPQ